MQSYDPNRPGLANGKLYGIPCSREKSELIAIPVTWDTTVSYRAGTSKGPEAILEESIQVEVFDAVVPDVWKWGIFMLPFSKKLIETNLDARRKAEKIIEAWELGEDVNQYENLLKEVNEACEFMNQWVEEKALQELKQDKIVAVLGGDHSTPLGLIRALSKYHADFGILQIDAHMDLRNAYEGFTYSHASIMYNSLKIPQVTKIIQVGVRDYCDEELDLIKAEKNRVIPFSFRDLQKEKFQGRTWAEQVNDILSHLPERVYISFDIDGLLPSLCPDTGTPVPGGFQFEEALFLIDQLAVSGKQIIGFDLCEVAPGNNEWNAIVGARILYRLYAATIKNKLIKSTNEF